MPPEEPEMGKENLPDNSIVNDLYAMPGHLIRRLQQASVAVVISKFSEYGYDLTPVQFAAMKTLALHPGIDQASLASLIAYDRTTIGGVVDRLVQKDLVIREVSPTDRRARILQLSQQGQKALREVEPLILEAQHEILLGLPVEDHEAFTQQLRKCLNALNHRTRKPALKKRV